MDEIFRALFLALKAVYDKLIIHIFFILFAYLFTPQSLFKLHCRLFELGTVCQVLRAHQLAGLGIADSHVTGCDNYQWSNH